MAAVIKIEVTTTGGLDAVKKDLSSVGDAAAGSGKGFSSLQEVATGALRAIGAAGVDLAIKGFQALGGAVTDGIADAKLNAQIQAQTAAVLKSTGNAAGVSAQHISDYASSLSDAAGKSLFGDDQVQQSTNMLLTFTEIKGKVLDAATAISVDMAQALGGAPKDSAIQLGKALNDPVKGVTALTRVGVTFTDSQKEQIAAMQKAGDTAGAQGIILGELNKEFGGSAKAAADATGGWSEFNGRMGEAKESLGTAVLPILSTLAGVLNDTVMPAVEKMASAFSAWVNDPATQAGLTSITGAITTGIGDAFTYISDTVIPVLISAWHTIQPALQVVGAFIADTVIPAIGDLVAWFKDNLPGAIAMLTTYWNTTLLPIFNALVDLWTTHLQPALSALWGWLKDNLPGAIQTLVGFWRDTLQPVIARVADFIATVLIPEIGKLVDWLAANLPIAIQKVSDFWTNTLWPALQKVWAFIQDSVIPIVTKIATEVFDTLNKAVQEVSAFWTNTLWPALQKVWAFIQDNVMPLLTALANVAIALVKKEVELLAALWTNVLWPALNKVWAFIQDNVMPILKDLGEKAMAGLKVVTDALSKLWTETLLPALTKVYQFIYDRLAPQLATFNTNILEPMKGFFEDIGGAIQAMIRWLNDLAKKIAEIKVPDWLQGHSPPPMADWFSYIGDSVQALNQQLPTLAMNLSAQLPASGQSVASTVTNSRPFSYNAINNNYGAPSEGMDLALARSLANV